MSEAEKELEVIRLKAMELLARREHSAFELRRKLLQRDFAIESINTVIEEFQQQSYLSDLRFAQQYVQVRMTRGYGPVKIQQELKARGVDGQTTRQCLDEMSDQWEEVITRVYAQRFSQDCADLKERMRRMRQLNQRGFTTEQIKKVIEIENYV